MDYEKAYKEAKKRGKEALLRCRQLSTEANMAVVYALDYVFGETKESEDERIRQCIGLSLTDVDEQRFKDFGTTLKECLAYLERQKDKVVEFDHDREQKPAKWNDADDKIQRNLMSLLSCMRGDRIAEATYKKYYPWLRDLPKRFNLQPPAEWSEEDEKNWNEYIERLKLEYSKTPNVVLWDDINWLEILHKKLKSLRPQPKQKWSQEDNDFADDAIACVTRCHEKYIDNKEFYQSLRHNTMDIKRWLIKVRKRLTPQWKPSKEQVGTLKQWLQDHELDGDSRYVYPIFESLYHDLKAL